MRLSEDAIVNAICLSVARRKMIQPTQVEVQMMWDEEYGFSAEATAAGRSQILIQATILEAIEQYMNQVHNVRVFRDQITLVLEDEIIAEIAE